MAALVPARWSPGTGHAMAFEVDDEILQDFLVEAEEALEALSEDLVELERAPDDRELLNRVFRGFHNIKGGAGFLDVPPLVELCHRAEDVFNTLRQGERRVDAELMDAVLQALDRVTAMVAAVRAGHPPESADPELLARLESLAEPRSESPAPPPAGAAPEAPPSSSPPPAEAAPGPPAGDGGDEGDGGVDPADQAFEAMLEGAAAPEAPPADDEITDEEFEALLDRLHGEGRHRGVPAAAPPPGGAAEAGPETPAGDGPAASAEDRPAGPDEITDEEFEALLDRLHGKGRHQGRPRAEAAPGPAPEAPPAPARAEETPKPAAAEGPRVEATVRVDTRRLDDIMNMVGELVLVRNRFANLREAYRDERFSAAVSNLDVVTSDLQLAVMKTRMQPIKKVFGRFPRLVRDLARSLGRQVRLEMRGEDTDLDKNLVEALADPLIHLVRNAVDHGIEPPAEREAAGKPAEAVVTLSAEQEGDHIRLTVADDGRGMDAEVLRRKVVEKGLLEPEEAARLDTEECYNLIFLPGFSTKQEASDVSGRGVGMDVVKTRIAQLNGAIDIETAPGRGTRFYIKVPLTLAIMPTLMVVVGDRVFALPLLSILEIVDYTPADTKTVDGQLVFMLRNRPLPLFHLRRWLLEGPARHAQAEGGHVVIVGLGARQVGFVVDELLGQEEVVIKPLGALLQGTPGLAGATITGSGRIALILDVPGLIKAYAGRMGEVA